MEFLNVVNENDEVFVFNEKGEMALQKRSRHVPFCPLHRCTAAAGHVRSGETYEQAAIRETEEELGFSPVVRFLNKDFYVRDAESFKGVRKILASFAASNGTFKIDEKAVEKVDFFSLDKIQKMIDRGEKFHPELLFLLRKHYGIR